MGGLVRGQVVLCVCACGQGSGRHVTSYRKRLGERGMARFEVLGRDTDRDLIRDLARALAIESPESVRLRNTVRRSIDGAPSAKGGILRALRNSPLVGAELDLTRLDPRRLDL